MTDILVEPCWKLRGDVRVPGDKSISHRLALIASMADGDTRIFNFSRSADCHSTLECLTTLGVPVFVEAQDQVTIQGVGLRGFHSPSRDLDAGNSGSTFRMLSGLLAGHPFTSTLVGDASLTKRPMRRIMEPLSQMGARFEARDEQYPPLKIHGARLHGIQYSLPIPSAQVKTSILLAGLLAEGRTEVIETTATRNHTEIVLHRFGARVSIKGPAIRLEGGTGLHGGDFLVPGDPSSAAFWIAAGLLVPNSELKLHKIGLNATRIRFLEIILSMGGELRFPDPGEANGEPMGDIVVRSSDLRGGIIDPADVPALIDEIPILAVLGARSLKGLAVRGAKELRFKESDRISAIVHNLRAMGAQVQEFEDGFEVKGRQSLQGATIDSFGDHRIAMAFSIAALVAESPSTIRGADCARISFPDFFKMLDALRR